MSKRILGAFLTLFGGICWGVSGSVGQYLFSVQGMDSRWLVPIRLGLSGIILFVFCLIKYKGQTFSVWKTRRKAVFILIYGIFGISCCQFLYFMTIQHSSAAVGTILQNLSPVVILVACCLLDKRRPKALEIISIFLAIAGIFILTTHGDPTTLVISPVALICGIGSAFCIMIYSVSAERFETDIPVYVIQAWSFLLGGTIFSLIFQPWNFGYVPTVKGWLGIAVVVIIGNILSFSTFLTGVRLIGPLKGTLYGFSEPVTAAIITAIFFKLPVTWWDVCGYILIFVMIILISFQSSKNKM